MDFSKALSRWTDRPAAELDAAALRLVTDAQAAARLRAYRTDPNVAALTIERTRDRLDRWGWLFLFAGLAYTTVNVQRFVADGVEAWSLPWVVAWFIEPVVMGLMLVLLRGEQIANRYKLAAGGWVRGTRWTALLITYVMNTGLYWGMGDPKLIFIHSVPVLLVFLAAEALVQQRQTLTEVVDQLGAGPMSVNGTIPVLDVREPAVDGYAPQTPQEAPDGRGAAPTTPDDLSAPRTLKERCYEAFEALVDEGADMDTLGPAAVDRRAEVKKGTAKVSGRMDEFRDRYRREHEEVTDGDAEATG